MLTVCVWGADETARNLCLPALSAALNASMPSGMLVDRHNADLHFLLAIDASSAASTQAADTSLRQQLDDAKRAYAVLYGAPASQVAKAMAAIERHHSQHQLAIGDLAFSATATNSTTSLLPPTSPNWVWPCDKCSDADCENKLLSRLLSQRNLPPKR